MLAARTYPQIDLGPAPVGETWLVVAIQVRGLLADRDLVAPAAYLFGAYWPEKDCPVAEPYACAQSKSFRAGTPYLPPGADSFGDPGAVAEGGALPAGRPYDILLRTRIPDDVDLDAVVVRFGGVPFGPDRRDFLPLRGVPPFG